MIIFFLNIHQRMTSQINMKVIAPANEALIGEKYGVKNV